MHKHGDKKGGEKKDGQNKVVWEKKKKGNEGGGREGWTSYHHNDLMHLEVLMAVEASTNGSVGRDGHCDTMSCRLCDRCVTGAPSPSRASRCTGCTSGTK